MDSLTIPIKMIRFPNRCLGCGQEPTTTMAVTGSRGLELLAVHVSREIELRLPACASCHARQLLGRIAWYVVACTLVLGIVIVPLMVVGGGALSIEAGIFVVSAAFGLAILFRNYEAETYHRLFSPIHIARFDSRNNHIVIKTRDPALLEEIRTISR